jgi:FMN-dependent NADH-azoreductase
MKLLQVDSSACSLSRLTAGFAEEWKKNHPQGQVIYRDLLATVFPSVTDGWAATHLRRVKAYSGAEMLSLYLG